MKKYFDLLGHECSDKVSGFKGVVSSLSFDLYGCVQVVLSPKAGKDGKIPEGHWFDAKRLKKLSANPVMAVPNFEVAAGTERGANKLPMKG